MVRRRVVLQMMPASMLFIVKERSSSIWRASLRPARGLHDAFRTREGFPTHLIAMQWGLDRCQDVQRSSVALSGSLVRRTSKCSLCDDRGSEASHMQSAVRVGLYGPRPHPLLPAHAGVRGPLPAYSSARDQSFLSTPLMRLTFSSVLPARHASATAPPGQYSIHMHPTGSDAS